MNVLFLLTRTKIYRLNNRIELATSPNARFVPADFDSGALQPPPLSSRLATSAWSLFIQFWRFLLGLKPSTPSGPAKKMATIQELEVWVPGDLELTLFSIYSPAHSILWIATTSNNWMLMLTLMGIVGMQVCFVSDSLISKVIKLQLHALISMYKTLVKDKEIIAAEVMAEYNEGVRLFYLIFDPDLVLPVCLSTNKSYPKGCSCHDTPIGSSQCLGRLSTFIVIDCITRVLGHMIASFINSTIS